MPSDNLSTVIVESTAETKEWDKQDTVWMLSLYGTAIGAGTLFLPINAGLHGLWPLILMVLVAFPMTYFSHQALCRFVLSGASKGDITAVVDEHFGKFAGKIITWLYFFAIFPILLMYSVAITNTTESFLTHQLHVAAPPRVVLALSLVMALMVIVHFGQQLIVRSMSLLVYPFVGILMVLSFYLIPYWNTGIFQASHSILPSGKDQGLLMTLWLIVPVMVFSFNHSPIISSFAVRQKQRFGHQSDKKCSTILKYSHIMMVATVMFFVFSCVLSLSPHELMRAKQQNISILSYLANHFHTPVIAYIAPIIAFIAIAKSFLGHYLGAKEGLHGLIVKSTRSEKKQDALLKSKSTETFIELFMLVSCVTVATLNPSILGMIEMLGGPVIALILFIMPVYAIATVPAMKKYKHLPSNLFIVLLGLIAISAVFYGILI